jgi:hypothetical protein
MHIKFTYHSIERSNSREISIEEIKKVVLSPDSIVLSNDLYICKKRIDKRILTVVYRKIINTAIIITTY